MKFTRAFHTTDANGRTRTLGIDRLGKIYLLDTDAHPAAEYAVFDFATTIRFANMLISLAAESLRARDMSFPQTISVPTLQIQCCLTWIPYPTPDYVTACPVCHTTFAIAGE